MVVSQQVGMQPGDFLPVVCDVTKEAEVRNLPQIISKHWPGAGIDVLVNNAGGSTGQSGLRERRLAVVSCEELPCVFVTVSQTLDGDAALSLLCLT